MHHTRMLVTQLNLGEERRRQLERRSSLQLLTCECEHSQACKRHRDQCHSGASAVWMTAAAAPSFAAVHQRTTHSRQLRDWDEAHVDSATQRHKVLCTGPAVALEARSLDRMVCGT